MKRVIIYPDNSVKIDGKDVDWNEEDIKKFGIKLNRVTTSRTSTESGEVFISGEFQFLVYPTHACSTGSANQRLNYRGQKLRKKYGKDYFLKKRRMKNDQK